MTRRSITSLALALTAALSLGACGNVNQEGAEALRNLPKTLLAKKEPPKPLTLQEIATAVSSTTASVFMFEYENLGAQFLLQDIEQNGPYHTYGNPTRQVVVLRDGMITATRGFGGDLMSSEEDGLFSLVRSRTTGRTSYDQRFLTPENLTIVRRYSCYVSPGGSVPVVSDVLQVTGSSMEAVCTGVNKDSPDFTNTYTVSGDGYILGARQWLGPTIGYFVSQALRR